MAAGGRPGLRLADWRAHLWINPSPNAPNLWMARAYAGTVMLEGATPPKGAAPRGRWNCSARRISTRAMLIGEMQRISRRNGCKGCLLRDCWFEPTFHKHVHKLCNGVQIHTEDPARYDHEAFKPWRVQALGFKAIRSLYRDYPLWRGQEFKYEYGRASRHRRHQWVAAAARMGG
jgi:uncharacterized protein YbbC (DUF1343 family)